MYQATLEQQHQIIHDCFNENKTRDCYRCPAKYTRPNGICCFGNPSEHDPETSDCAKCIFLDDCAAEVSERIKEQEEEDEIEREALRQASWGRSYRPTLPVKRAAVPIPIRRSIPTNPKSELVQIGGLRPSVITPPSPAKVERTEEPLFQRFMKDTVWGMGQGFFETAAHFFRTHRLR